MSLSRWVESLFIGEDMRDEKDREIAYQRSQAINNTQAVQSGARLVQHMSGMLKLMAEENAK